MADQPYTEADLKALGEKLQAARTVLKRMDDGYMSAFQADGEELARVALDHLAAAGRLLPEGPRPPADTSWIKTTEGSTDG